MPFGNRSLSLSRLPHIESSAFDIHERPADRADRRVKHCRFRRFDVLHQKWRPRLDMFFEKSCLRGKVRRRAEGAADHPGHYVKQACDMIFWVVHTVDTLDFHLCHIVTQICERLIIQEPSKIKRRVGEQFTTTDADEKAHILIADFITGQFAGKRCQNTASGSDSTRIPLN